MALRLLGIRMHSEAELSRKLVRRGYEPDEIATVIRRCVSAGYLDDGRFAAALVERRAPGRGVAAMAAELRSKGVGRDQIETALAPVDREAEIAAAMLLVARLHPSGPDWDERDLLASVGPRLLRRGFTPPVVREACRRHLALT